MRQPSPPVGESTAGSHRAWCVGLGGYYIVALALFILAARPQGSMDAEEPA
jgi:hypothetical protein